MGTEGKSIKYSFIIPHRNSPELLKKCVDSIPQREDVQIVVIDDNSNENFLPKIERRNLELYYIDAEHSRGAGYARNLGLTKALGHWVLFADADDYYKDGFLEYLDSILDDNIDVLYFNVESNSQNEESRGNLLYKRYNYYFNKKRFDIIKFGLWAPWNKVAKRSFLEVNKIYFEERPIGNDQYFNLRLSQVAEKTKIIDTVLYVLTDQEFSITYGQKQTFSRLLNSLELSIQRDHVFRTVKVNSLRRPLLDFRILNLVKRNFGWNALGRYIRTLNSYRNIFLCILDVFVFKIGCAIKLRKIDGIA